MRTTLIMTAITLMLPSLGFAQPYLKGPCAVQAANAALAASNSQGAAVTESFSDASVGDPNDYDVYVEKDADTQEYYGVTVSPDGRCGIENVQLYHPVFNGQG